MVNDHHRSQAHGHPKKKKNSLPNISEITMPEPLELIFRSQFDQFFGMITQHNDNNSNKNIKNTQHTHKSQYT